MSRGDEIRLINAERKAAGATAEDLLEERTTDFDEGLGPRSLSDLQRKNLRRAAKSARAFPLSSGQRATAVR